MTKRALRKIETQKKKARRTIARPATTRSLGNTNAGRTRLKKAAGLARVKKAATKA